MLDHDDYIKFKVTIQGTKRKNILVSFIQDWIKKSGSKKQNQTIELHIYTFDQNADVIQLLFNCLHKSSKFFKILHFFWK